MSDIALTACHAPQPREYNISRRERTEHKITAFTSHYRTLIIIRLATYPSWVEYVTENSSAVLETFGASDLAVGIQNKHARVFDICICQPWGFTSTCVRRRRVSLRGVQRGSSVSVLRDVHANPAQKTRYVTMPTSQVCAKGFNCYLCRTWTCTFCSSIIAALSAARCAAVGACAFGRSHFLLVQV